ncbi:MAG TPA: glycosyltransferase family 2 protein [Chitinophagaceae bacterium]|jgi:GalNAc5-diNAcBac-PP-undecaprenol beta-1,3-glucosyltransferase|nr:glycosyltransferase family 2 protein [Chitinophagaceae bacterium]
MKPLVSVIIPTYNRATTIGRTIESLLSQTYDNLDIIVVEDGSHDETLQLLGDIKDQRLRVIRHEVNRGVTAAKNTGLNSIRGEWFTILDSDDEIVADAIDVMMQIPLEKDPAVTAVTCNCIDTGTGAFSGKGLSSDQYLDFDTLMNVCTGEYWGLTKTELLSSDRFNEQLNGYEGVLWNKINEKAKRFYIHKALRIYHTEGSDRVSKTSSSISKISNHYRALSNELHYLEILRKYSPGAFAKDCLRAVLYLVADKKKEAKFYYFYLKKTQGNNLYKTISFFVYHSNAFIAKTLIKLLTAAKIVK